MHESLWVGHKEEPLLHGVCHVFHLDHDLVVNHLEAVGLRAFEKNGVEPVSTQLAKPVRNG
jgi:hypothetical protein